MSPSKGWIGVDLDGTLATYDGWVSETHIGQPIMVMVNRVQAWRAQGYGVKIVTARVASRDPHELAVVRSAIERWCMEHIGEAIPTTCCKDYAMIELWDDRCVQVERNTGRRMDGLDG